MTGRSIRGSRLVIATHNRGKLREIDDLLRPHGVAVVSAADLGLAEPEETAATFAGNAAIKAQAAARAAGCPALADDSGLSVAVLDGAPGVHSARWAGPEKDFSRAMRNLQEQLAAKAAITQQSRRAEFVCVLCVGWPDGAQTLFEGRVAGTLAWPPRGDKGFGYDPMFVPDGHALTFGEMEPGEKHRMSHRARAFDKFRMSCL
ncbi:MAG: RdgB/HAM1 family non-canonical purine NTP pyrophosphatase [Pseudomonadota bacterium]|nr:RdgB/HAM1 family non-canonical purine NTP pyrophosphatase [Pseudomonadota bacterium]